MMDMIFNFLDMLITFIWCCLLFFNNFLFGFFFQFFQNLLHSHGRIILKYVRINLSSKLLIFSLLRWGFYNMVEEFQAFDCLFKVTIFLLTFQKSHQTCECIFCRNTEINNFQKARFTLKHLRTFSARIESFFKQLTIVTSLIGLVSLYLEASKIDAAAIVPAEWYLMRC